MSTAPQILEVGDPRSEASGGAGRARHSVRAAAGTTDALNNPTDAASAPYQVSEKPMLFSSPMVRAILAGNKTQTRRVMKPQPVNVEYWLHGERSDRMNGLPVMREANGKGWSTCGPFKCPWKADGMYASSGGELKPATDDGPFVHSRIWLKETWAAWSSFRDEADEVEGTAQDLAERGITQAHIAYRADYQTHADRWRPSIFMPRWASRITLEIVSVRVERLQEISEADAIAEGLHQDKHGLWTSGNYPSGSTNPVYAYQLLWESVNGPGSWELNPFVWVITFKRI